MEFARDYFKLFLFHTAEVALSVEAKHHKERDAEHDDKPPRKSKDDDTKFIKISDQKVLVHRGNGTDDDDGKKVHRGNGKIEIEKDGEKVTLVKNKDSDDKKDDSKSKRIFQSLIQFN